MRIVLAECDSSTAQFNFEPSKMVANLIVEIHTGELRIELGILSYNVSTRQNNCTYRSRSVEKEKESERRKRAVGRSKLMEDGGIDYP